MKRTEKTVLSGIGLQAAFGIWTVLIQRIDVQPIGPNGTNVGMAAFNGWFHRLTGVHMGLYTITDWLGLVPILICVCFGVLGAVQLFGRRSLKKVDPDIILLGLYYLLVIAAYLLFEMVPINYRPILIDGFLEASYPSSTTLQVLSVMPTLTFQARRRFESASARKATVGFAVLFSTFMVMGRLVAGVHWATDIIGSILLSFGLFTLYRFCVGEIDNKKVSFGPICVDPRFQRQKLGKRLIEYSFDAARRMGYDVNINFGNPGNYVSRRILYICSHSSVVR